jgi:hypothetical protein
MNNATIFTDDDAEEVFLLGMLATMPMPKAVADAGISARQAIAVFQDPLMQLRVDHLIEGIKWAHKPAAIKWAYEYDRKAAEAARPVVRVVPAVTAEGDNVMRVQFGKRPRPA